MWHEGLIGISSGEMFPDNGYSKIFSITYKLPLAGFLISQRLTLPSMPPLTNQSDGQTSLLGWYLELHKQKMFESKCAFFFSMMTLFFQM